MGADEEAKQQIAALAQLLYQFGHQKEERELELGQRLANVAEMSEVQRSLAKIDNDMQRESIQFAQKLVAQVDTEIKNVHKRLDDFGNKVQYVEYVLVPGVTKAEEKLTARVEQIEEGLRGIHTEWKVQLDRELVGTREALKAQINQETTAME